MTLVAQGWGDLDLLFKPRRVAVVGATENDPARMGTRTLHDLVKAGWRGEVFPVSQKSRSLYGLPTFPSLSQVPRAPDVVLARTPSGTLDGLVEEAVAVGARYLIVLAAGFAESGHSGLQAQRRLLARAAEGKLRIVGPQSIGLVNFVDALPLSMSQIMERVELRAGRTALLSQSGAMAISLAVRGQSEVGLDYSYLATFGNSADVDAVEALHWLSKDENTDAVGLYLEGIADGQRFAQAVLRCRAAGKPVAILRAGLSRRGAQAVASHTASMSGDADTFRALCAQLGVSVFQSSEEFLWALKALTRTRLTENPRTGFASISGGACALWADHAERCGLDLPQLTGAQIDELGHRLPPFLKAANPMDLGPAVFDPASFSATVQSLLEQQCFNLLAVYLFTSSPSLMGGVEKIRLLETIARKTSKPVWVIWEAATSEEWSRLVRNDALVAFRELAQAARALGALQAGIEPPAFLPCAAQRARRPVDVRTEPGVKSLLREIGLSVPRGEVFTEVEAARRYALATGHGVVLKIVSLDVRHKSEIGGVVFCRDPERSLTEALGEIAKASARMENAQILVEELVDEPGVEMFLTVRNDPVYGLVTVMGRGGVDIEVEKDYVLHVGLMSEDDVRRALERLRSYPLLCGHRGRPRLPIEPLARAIRLLHDAMRELDLRELELNPVKLTAREAWVLDALAT